jgi:hypothetical protein
MNKQTILSLSVATILGATAPAAQSAVIDATWNGLFTLYSAQFGQAFENTSYPYYSDPAWGYGLRTQISGSLNYDTTSGTGTGTVAGFDWGNAGTWQIHDLVLQGVGDGAGGPGDLILGNFLYDWNSNVNVPGTIVWDASGMLNAGSNPPGGLISGNGALPASNGLDLNAGHVYPIGPSPLASTTLDSALPIVDDGVAGGVFTAGPWLGFNANIDVTSMQLPAVASIPLPASLWMFGSGLIGVLGLAGRKQAA